MSHIDLVIKISHDLNDKIETLRRSKNKIKRPYCAELLEEIVNQKINEDNDG